MPSKHKLKFRLELRVEQLLAVPYKTGMLLAVATFCRQQTSRPLCPTRYPLLQDQAQGRHPSHRPVTTYAARPSAPSIYTLNHDGCRVRVADHAVQWSKSFDFPVKLILGESGVVDSSILKIAVRREQQGSASHVKVVSRWPLYITAHVQVTCCIPQAGVASVDLSEFAGRQGVQRRYLLEPETKDSRQDNSVLKVCGCGCSWSRGCLSCVAELAQLGFACMLGRLEIRLHACLPVLMRDCLLADCCQHDASVRATCLQSVRLLALASSHTLLLTLLACLPCLLASSRPYTEAFPNDDEIDGVDLTQALGASSRLGRRQSSTAVLSGLVILYYSSVMPHLVIDRLKISDSQASLQPGAHNSWNRSDAGAVVDEILRAAGSHPTGSMASLPTPLATAGRKG